MLKGMDKRLGLTLKNRYGYGDALIAISFLRRLMSKDNLMQLLLDLYEFLEQFGDSWTFGGEIAMKSAEFQRKLTIAIGELSIPDE